MCMLEIYAFQTYVHITNIYDVINICMSEINAY